MPGIYLQLVRGTEEDGAVRKCPGTRFVVGRTASCAVRLRSGVASRKHAILEYRRGCWTARDLESRNGLYLNGQRIVDAEIRPLDTLEFGTRGPRIRVISLDPSPPMDSEGTRFFQAVRPLQDGPGWPGEAGEEEEELEAVFIGLEESSPGGRPMPPIGDDSPTTEAEVGRSFPFPLFLVLSVVGLTFGGLAAFQVWPPDWFPYRYVTAPAGWAVRGLVEVFPDVALSELGLWIFRGILALWCGAVFAAFARPRRWFLWILLLLALHAVAISTQEGWF